MKPERERLLRYDVTEPATPHAPAIILSSGLGGLGAYWEPQVEALARHLQVVTYDHRGTGRSGGDVPVEGGIGTMADDVLQVADVLGLETFHFMGHALGGLIGLEIALRYPSRLASLVLVNAWSKIDPVSERCFDTRIALLDRAGVEAFVRAQPLFLYPSVWISQHEAQLALDDASGVTHFQGRTNVLRRIAALRAFDREAQLSEIRTPTFVVATRDDLLVPYTRSIHLSQAIPRARLSLLDTGAHAVNHVEPERFNKVVGCFLQTVELGSGLIA